jgi:hypothetical protein
MRRPHRTPLPWLGIGPTFPVFDNAPVIAEIANVPDVRSYLTGGVKFNSKPVMNIYSSDMPAAVTPHLPLGARSPPFHG